MVTPTRHHGLYSNHHSCFLSVGLCRCCGVLALELEFGEVLELIRRSDWSSLARSDQLSKEMSAQNVFPGFREGALKFCPTYRWERRENVFSNKKFQSPSWTDRVLWHSLPGLDSLLLEKYSNVPNM